MRIKMLEDSGYCDGHLLILSRIVALTPTAALDYLKLGKAEHVEEPAEEVAEEVAEPVIETASVAPPEAAMRKPGRPRKA